MTDTRLFFFNTRRGPCVATWTPPAEHRALSGIPPAVTIGGPFADMAAAHVWADSLTTAAVDALLQAKMAEIAPSPTAGAPGGKVGKTLPANPPTWPTATPPKPAVPPAPSLAGIQLRPRMLRCGKAGCTTCPHGPYWYVTIRRLGKRADVALGRDPKISQFYRKLAGHLTGDEIVLLVREWATTKERKEQHDPQD